MPTTIHDFYDSYSWPDDPFSDQGKSYYAQALKNMEALVLSEFFPGKNLKQITEFCSGAGYGSIALAKTMLKQGEKTDLLITDIREPVLETAQKFARQELAYDVSTQTLDLLSDYENLPATDIALFYGLSLPHFNPWEVVQILHRTSQAISKNGVLVIHETDRRLLEFLERDYQKIALTGQEKNPLVNLHTGYDILRGTIQRTYYGLNRSIPTATTNAFFWSIAELSAILWTAFNSIEFIHLGQYKYFIIATQPRKILSLKNFTLPSAFK